MAMAQVMNEVVDGVLHSFQERLAAVEMDLVDLRGELVALRGDFEASRRDEGVLRASSAGLQRRLERIERRLDAADISSAEQREGLGRG
jgi:hypothetical protein